MSKRTPMNTLNKLAQEYTKEYVQPTLLVRWVMLYREIHKMILFIDCLKGILKPEVNIISGAYWLCGQIQDEIENTPQNLKYLADIKNITCLVNEITFENVETNKEIEKITLEKINYLKGQVASLILKEKNNFRIEDFLILESINPKELLLIFNLINSQKENLPL